MIRRGTCPICNAEVILSPAPGRSRFSVHNRNGDPHDCTQYISLNQDGFPLSDRQREVLFLLVRGVSLDDIASSLAITKATVKVHVRAIGETFGQGSRNDIMGSLVDRGWLIYQPPWDTEKG